MAQGGQGESKRACVAWAILPSEGKHSEESVLAGSNSEEGRLLSGTLMGKKNQASATVQAHTCTEPLIHSEAARFQERRGFIDRGDGAIVE